MASPTCITCAALHKQCEAWWIGKVGNCSCVSDTNSTKGAWRFYIASLSSLFEVKCQLMNVRDQRCFSSSGHDKRFEASRAMIRVLARGACKRHLQEDISLVAFNTSKKL